MSLGGSVLLHKIAKCKLGESLVYHYGDAPWTVGTVFSRRVLRRCRDHIPETPESVLSLGARLQTRRLCTPLGKWRRLSTSHSIVFYYSASREFILSK